MARVDAVQDKGGKLADEVRGCLPYLYVRAMRSGGVSREDSALACCGSERQFGVRSCLSRTHFPSGENWTSLTGALKLKCDKTIPRRKLTRSALPSAGHDE